MQAGHFEPCVLLLKLSKPSYIERLELPEPLAPEVYRLLRDAVLLRRLGDRPCIGFPQDPNHLLFRKPCLLHRFLPPGESHHPKNQSVRKSPSRSHPCGGITITAKKRGSYALQARLTATTDPAINCRLGREGLRESADEFGVHRAPLTVTECSGTEHWRTSICEKIPISRF